METACSEPPPTQPERGWKGRRDAGAEGGRVNEAGEGVAGVAGGVGRRQTRSRVTQGRRAEQSSARARLGRTPGGLMWPHRWGLVASLAGLRSRRFHFLR